MAAISNGYGLVKRRLFTSLSCLMLLVSGYCYGPVYPTDVTGKRLGAEAPLLISTYGAAKEFFSAVSLPVVKKLGFINIALLDPDACYSATYEWGLPVWRKFLVPKYMQEASSYQQGITDLQLALTANDGVGLITNKRVIVYADGPTEKRGTIKFIEGRSKEYEYTEFGELLGHFFKDNNIKVNQVDLILSRGKIVGAKVLEGMEKTGMKNVVVRCLNGDTVGIKDGCIHIQGFDHQPDRKENIDPEPFFYIRRSEITQTRST